MSPQELSAFIEDEGNELKKSTQVNDTKVEVVYRPTDLWIDKEIEGQNFSVGKIDSLRSKYDKYFYFVLRLSKNDKEVFSATNDFAQFSELVQTISFRMNDYVTLTTPQNDTIPVGDFILNRTYGMSRSTEILFVFSRANIAGEKWVQFNLAEFGLGIGIHRFRFVMERLDNAPRVNFGRQS